jgi:hypothetical protein
VSFDIDAYSRRTARLDLDGIDFASFERDPLSGEALRCLRYMHDVEHHTVCYLRDLLVTRAHRDPTVTTFLTFWAFEEHWHGAAIGEVLAAHGEPANDARVAPMRRRLGLRNQIQPLLSQLGSGLTRHFTAVNMAWGAVNEWTTQAGYARLSRRAGHPELTEMLRRIMRQEGRHIDFYASQAREQLESSKTAQRLTRAALDRFWGPVGSGIMAQEEVRFLAGYLFAGEEGHQAAAQVDRRIERLPGLEGLSLLSHAVRELSVAS